MIRLPGEPLELQPSAPLLPLAHMPKMPEASQASLTSSTFAEAAKNLIHQKTEVQATNPIEQLVAKIKSWFG